MAYNEGPWFVGAARLVYSGEVEIAQVIRTGGDQDTAMSNAKIIAASPDMLEALQLVVGSLRFDREETFNAEVLRRVNTAIAKATGAGA